MNLKTYSLRNRLINGTITSAALETELQGSQATRAALEYLLRTDSGRASMLLGYAKALPIILASPTAFATVLGSAASAASLLSSTATCLLIAASPTAHAAMMASKFGVGTYLDRLAVNAGGTTNATLAGCNSLADVVANSAATTAVAATTTTSNLMIESQAVGAYFNRLTNAGSAVMAAITSMVALVASTTLSSVVNNSTGAGLVLASPFANDLVMRSANSVGMYLNTLRVLDGGTYDSTLVNQGTIAAVAATTPSVIQTTFQYSRPCRAVCNSAFAVSAMNSANALPQLVVNSTFHIALFSSPSGMAAMLANSLAPVNFFSNSSGYAVNYTGPTYPQSTDLIARSSANNSIGALFDRARIMATAASSDATLFACTTISAVAARLAALSADLGATSTLYRLVVYSPFALQTFMSSDAYAALLFTQNAVATAIAADPVMNSVALNASFGVHRYMTRLGVTGVNTADMTFAAVMARAGVAANVLGTSAAVNAILLDSTATNLVLQNYLSTLAASATGMAAFAASVSAMSIIAASSSMLTTLLASATARAAIFASDVALAAIAATDVGRAALRAGPGYSVKAITLNSTNAILATAITGNMIMVGWSVSDNTASITLAGRRPSTVGLLTAQAQTLSTDTQGLTDNVMALSYPVYVTAGDAKARTLYIGVLPV